jgi:hypothetical protein
MVSIRDNVEDVILRRLHVTDEHPDYREVEGRLIHAIRKVAYTYRSDIFLPEDLELFYKMKINKMLINDKANKQSPVFLYYRAMNNLNRDIEKQIKLYKKYGMSQDALDFCVSYEVIQ